MPQNIISDQQERILESIEHMAQGTRAKVEAKLKERGETLNDLLQVNENISFTSLLIHKGALYWNAIFVEKNGETKMYRISEYLKL